ncbi:MAG TPA: restriction endonuclease subunit S [Saprospiraceae bacterium]|nr:restriction endonuclease subunit S [Saprospiraceae bacterium]
MNNTLRDLADVEYGASPKEIRVDYTTPVKIFGTGGCVGYAREFLFEGPLIVVARKGTLDNPIFSEENCWVIDTAYAVIPKQDVNPKWLYYQLSNFDLKKLNEATGVPSINRDLLYKVRFNKTSPTEQAYISRILSTTDSVIEKTKAAIAKYKAIKQGMLQDLFTRGIDLSTNKLRPRYEDTPELYKPARLSGGESKLGWIPKEWEVEELEQLTEKIGSGITPTGGSEVYKSSGVLFLRSQNILIGDLSISDSAFITKEIDEMMQGSRVKPFDVLLNITGASIGRCAYFPQELVSANVNQHVCIIRFINASKPRAVFASNFLNSDFGQSQIFRLNAGGNREGLNFQQIKSFAFPVINIDELNAISRIIEAISDKLQLEQTYLRKLQQIKQGLMEDLLTGRKRVKLEELIATYVERD